MPVPQKVLVRGTLDESLQHACSEYSDPPEVEVRKGPGEEAGRVPGLVRAGEQLLLNQDRAVFEWLRRVQRARHEEPEAREPCLAILETELVEATDELRRD